MTLPPHGRPADDILAQLDATVGPDGGWPGGRAFAAYVADAPAAQAVGARAMERFQSLDAGDPIASPGLVALEHELVDVVAAHLGGGGRAAGDVTSGVSDSALLAVRSARDHARAHRPEIHLPNVVMPTTAHAAFHVACHVLGVEARLFDVDRATLRASPEAARAAIDDQTLLVVGSAPSRAHGVIDDIAGLASLAAERGLLMHVEAGLGGWLLPIAQRLGRPSPAFDLSVDGVTSLSVELHRTAACPLAVGVLLYRSEALRGHQIAVTTGWTGPVDVQTTARSIRSGGPSAAAWAVLQALGERGFREATLATLEATRALQAGLEEIDGLDLMGRPDSFVMATSSDTVSVFVVADEMAARGWPLQPQLGFRVHPPSLRFVASPGVADRIPAMLAALRESVEAARDRPPTDHDLVEEALHHLGPETLTDEAFARLLEVSGVEDGALPERRAALYETLNSLPPALADRLLTRFVSRLRSPRG